MTKIAIVTGSVRTGRQSLTVAKWVKAIAAQRADAEFEVVDIADFRLPVWDEAAPPKAAPGESEASKAWTAKLDEFDGYVFIVSEYNHSITGALKNALDYVAYELDNKAAAFVSYGAVGGSRAVEHLRIVLSSLSVAHVGNQVILPMTTEFENWSVFTPSAGATKSVAPMLDQLVSWTKAMESVRAGQLEQAA